MSLITNMDYINKHITNNEDQPVDDFFTKVEIPYAKPKDEIWNQLSNNIDNTHALVEAARQNKVSRYFFSSSACVYATYKQEAPANPGRPCPTRRARKPHEALGQCNADRKARDGAALASRGISHVLAAPIPGQGS